MGEKKYKYIIKDKELSEMYLQKGTIASYSSNLATAIHEGLPSHVSENGDYETEVIRSDNPRFREILKQKFNNSSEKVNELERSIKKQKQELSKEKRDMDVIKNYLDEVESSNGSRE